MSWKQLSENLYVWSDTCNVYCVKDGEHGLLIDAGSGVVVEHIEEIGVRQIDWVLHTHHHRDQCWGTGSCVRPAPGSRSPNTSATCSRTLSFSGDTSGSTATTTIATHSSQSARTCRLTNRCSTTRRSPGADLSWRSSRRRATRMEAACSSARSMDRKSRSPAT